MSYVRSAVSVIPRDVKRISNFAAEAAKREAEMKTRFLATMSHDIRTPLNGIIGMVNMGNQYADDPQIAAEDQRKGNGIPEISCVSGK